ncbi:hypothetical protein DFAR_1470024 [Desulfarculales bacterium]
MKGRPATGASTLEQSYKTGRSLVPRPPASTTTAVISGKESKNWPALADLHVAKELVGHHSVALQQLLDALV